MSFVSPALVARIYQALGQDKGSEAMTFLRQETLACPPPRNNKLMSDIVNQAEHDWISGDYERAEEHFQLGLALYNSCFHQHHTEALRCVAALMCLAEQRRDCRQMRLLVETADEITAALRTEFFKPKVIAV